METTQANDLLYVSQEDLKNLAEMGLVEQQISRYCEMSQKLLNVFLVAYEQGIKKMTTTEIIIVWYKLYGNKLQTAQQIKTRLLSFRYLRCLKYDYGTGTYSLIEDDIDEVKYQLSLKSSEHKIRKTKKETKND